MIVLNLALLKVISLREPTVSMTRVRKKRGGGGGCGGGGGGRAGCLSHVCQKKGPVNARPNL